MPDFGYSFKYLKKNYFVRTTLSENIITFVKRLLYTTLLIFPYIVVFIVRIVFTSKGGEKKTKYVSCCEFFHTHTLCAHTRHGKLWRWVVFGISSIPTMFPTMFPTAFPTDFPTMFPTRSMIPSRPVPTRNRVLPSRPVNRMASHLPVPFPSRGKQTGTFSRTVHREDPKKIPPAAAKSDTVPYRAVPSAPRVPLVIP